MQDGLRRGSQQPGHCARRARPPGRGARKLRPRPRHPARLRRRLLQPRQRASRSLPARGGRRKLRARARTAAGPRFGTLESGGLSIAAGRLYARLAGVPMALDACAGQRVWSGLRATPMARLAATGGSHHRPAQRAWPGRYPCSFAATRDRSPLLAPRSCSTCNRRCVRCSQDSTEPRRSWPGAIRCRSSIFTVP